MNILVEFKFLQIHAKIVSGWISVTGRRGTNVQLRAWTPDKRGCFVRDCLLPQAVNLKGVRIRSTPAYKKYIYYAEDDLWY